MEQEVGTWDSVLLENLSEDSFINNIHLRYKRDLIYTYIGTSVVAVNPYHHISENTLELIHNYGSKGIFQLPPHIYGLANLSFQSLKDKKEDQCIIITGESGSGKTESFKMIVNFLTHIQEKSKKNPSLCKQTYASSATGPHASACVSASLTPPTGIQRHRRTSSSCSVGNVANVMLCKNAAYSGSASSCLVITPQRRQSPSPGPTIKRCDAATQHRSRAESSERHGKRSMREKMVDFDFSHHKSTENIASVDSSTYTQAASAPTYGRTSTSLGLTLSPHPTKSCFKHHQSTQASYNTAAQSKSTSTMYIARSTSPKFSAFSSNSCRQCGHSKCTRAQSFDRDDGDLSISSQPSGCRGLSAYPTVNLQRGSCSNLVRQTSSECYGRDERSSLSGSMQRISLYDAYKLTQSTNAQKSTSPGAVRRHKNPLKRLRECVSYADVFLEAMGNAVTQKNNNSSRYGKLFDIEIDFKGDPIGVHITHYSSNKHNFWGTKFSYILSIAVWW